MKILQINTSVNSGSTGRIAEDIGLAIREAGYDSFIAGAYTNQLSQSEVIAVGNDWDRKLHGIKTRLFDRHGFGSANSTKRLIAKIREIKPDLIHLQNIHGYYLNIQILFDYLKEVQLPVVWTFHDCWPFTGHCTYFDAVNCSKWQVECHHCPNLKAYPASWLIDQSSLNFKDKKRLFNGLSSLHIVTPSIWLANHIKKSFLSSYPVWVINNGIDLTAFKLQESSGSIRNKYNLKARFILLGVASIWDKRKGLSDFIQLSEFLEKDMQLVLVGLSKEQQVGLPANITAIERTENIGDLAALYSAADVFINPTYVDNFPTTNIEALACGTPVITYKTGGSPEAIDEQTGIVVEKGDVEGLNRAIQTIVKNGKARYSEKCRNRAVSLYNKNDRYSDYLKLYEKILHP